MVAATVTMLAMAGSAGTASAGPAGCRGLGVDLPPSAQLVTLVGDAAVRDGAIDLTADAPDQDGAAWTEGRADLVAGFAATFRFTIPSDGVDGLAFVVQAARADALGGGGGGMGYDGLRSSLAVEFDTWQNIGSDFPSGTPDPNANHVSVQTLGPGRNTADPAASLATATAIPDLSDGRPHRVVVDYHAGHLAVLLDGLPKPVIDLGVDLAGLFDRCSAWVGLTAATGGVSEAHIVHSFNLTPRV